ncbi:MAG: succinate dehydrogenase cytochrome b subunit [Bacteroidetes bacterium]|uniref:Succinate dehydrogenase cytochrome b subunit n=2 Tax=Bacteroidales TaxID=171549 RepID=A0A9D9IIB1_9BACT|nr:succinate dehydrogenase cytochrome b subunit [Candidatus Merdivivens pullicola]
MATIFKSSIGKKLIMSISGLFLILFLLIHVTVNSLSLISPEAFEAGCEFMALPVITVIVPILALGFIIHIIYATVLTLGNLKARGNTRYAVPHKGASDSFAAKNMFVLGIIVLGVLAFHLTHFWADMQLQEWMGNEPEDPNGLLAQTFSSPWITVIYIIWFAALWFHLTHGFWSAFQTIGFNNMIWIKRLKVIAYIVATIIFLGFTATALAACFRANCIL